MSRFTKSVKKTFNFDGDVVYVEFQRLKVSDFRVLTSEMEFDSSGRPTGQISFDSQVEMLSRASDILPDKIISFRGLKDADGNELEFDDIANEQYFIELISQIFREVMNSSVISDPKPQGATSDARLKVSERKDGEKEE